MSKALMINCCANCHYFEYVNGVGIVTDRTYCNIYNRRIIPQSIDPSDETPAWCPLPDWETLTTNALKGESKKT